MQIRRMGCVRDLKKPLDMQLVKKSPHLLCIPKAHYHVQNSPPPDSDNLNHLNTVSVVNHNAKFQGPSLNVSVVVLTLNVGNVDKKELQKFITMR
jgi:hypothetical protein